MQKKIVVLLKEPIPESYIKLNTYLKVLSFRDALYPIGVKWPPFLIFSKVCQK